MGVSIDLNDHGDRCKRCAKEFDENDPVTYGPQDHDEYRGKLLCPTCGLVCQQEVNNARLKAEREKPKKEEPRKHYRIPGYWRKNATRNRPNNN